MHKQTVLKGVYYKQVFIESIEKLKHICLFDIPKLIRSHIHQIEIYF